MRFFKPPDGLLILAGIGNVAVLEHDRLAGILQLLGQRSSSFCHQIDEADAGALRGETLHDCFADA